MWEEAVTSLVDQAQWLVDLFKLAATIGGLVFSLRKWILKPVVNSMDENKKDVIALQEDYKKEKKILQEEIASLRSELRANDAKSEQRHKRIRDDFKEMREELATAQDDIADVLGNELEMWYQKFIKQGWCSPGEKQHYVDLYKRYSSRGHNHLALHYEENLLDLPDDPPENVAAG